MEAAQPLLGRDEPMVPEHLARGMSLDGAARRTRISDSTVRRRYEGICDRLDVDAPVQAVASAAKRGLL